MNAIIGMSYLALRTDLNPKQYDYLKKIDISAKSLLSIIDDIKTATLLAHTVTMAFV